MKNIIIIMSILLVTLSSCDQSGIFEEHIGDTPYEFRVVACTDAEDVHLQPIAGVLVQLFRTEADRDAGAPICASATTDEKGEAIFPEAILNPNKNVDEAKGIYYLKLSKNNYQSKNATSRYLLLNSGHTYQWVQMVP